MNYTAFNFDKNRIDLDDKTVLVTGGTGSFGKEFIRAALANNEMRRCIVFSRDEQKHYDMSQEFPPKPGEPIRYFIGDVRDVDRLELAMRGVDYVVHAAAMKHVPAAEYNPFECVQTNIHGAENIVKAALRTGVKKVLALSTDKAANPINLYGATKLASDKIFVAANNIAGQDGCRFAVVRYGNVIGSRGSVIPFFRKLISEGASDLPITDERMTRFWITLRQGVNFVLSSMEMMKGREIFVPKIPSMKIVDVAKTMAPELPMRNVGIRPGEKLHEVMISEDDSRTTVELEDRYVILPANSDRVMTEYLEAGAKPVVTDFRYASDTNTAWLSGEDLTAMMETL
ncbi:UDP-N-acetylglucosamine 4,6-dehydratase (inverting) [Nisaea acidiphila]|uniref:UDP-N-acetylglucosamine 4,6-dehydratase (Inverting) n=1 Tax=Nisaea acidiphila TaxID=1862145 RepID=A0A9J7AQF9_9PROT|nr:UDP-N-acetylglucosamine 4,6-dehydratase (inverting) [Nisaea acidiphila]UUX49398.1 UDP-N-acetylglucosamine 4,6-dehydratase (inverting) [Nisaea acidiphila]